MKINFKKTRSLVVGAIALGMIASTAVTPAYALPKCSPEVDHACQTAGRVAYFVAIVTFNWGSADAEYERAYKKCKAENGCSLFNTTASSI